MEGGGCRNGTPDKSAAIFLDKSKYVRGRSFVSQREFREEHVAFPRAFRERKRMFLCGV